MNKENCTKGPVTAKPFLAPDHDDDPMMVYKVEGGDLQHRYDTIPVDAMGDYDQDIVEVIHKENKANAELIAEAFNVLHETGYTPRELLNLYTQMKTVVYRAYEATKPDSKWTHEQLHQYLYTHYIREDRSK